MVVRSSIVSIQTRGCSSDYTVADLQASRAYQLKRLYTGSEISALDLADRQDTSLFNS